MSSINARQCSRLTRSSLRTKIYRQFHDGPRLMEENKKPKLYPVAASSSSETKSPESRQRRSAIALKQVQSLRSKRQGIVGVTAGGFGSAKIPDNSTRRTSNNSFRPPQQLAQRVPSLNSQSRQPDMRPRQTLPRFTGSLDQRPSRGPGMTSRPSTTTRSRINNEGRRGSRGARRNPKDKKEADDDAPITVPEEKALQELFWMRQEQGEAAARQEPDFNPGEIENAQSLAISTGALVTQRTSSLAGRLGPKTQLTNALGRLAQRPDDTWAIDADLARRLLSGKLMQFRSKEERQRVFKLADQYAVKMASNTAVRTGKPFEKKELEWKPIPAMERMRLTRRLINGQYDLHDRATDRGAAAQAVGQIETALNVKETMTPFASRLFVDTFKKLYPSAATQGKNA